MTRARTLVVILNWNGAARTLACLQRVREQSDADRDVLVIDNGSADASVRAIRDGAPLPIRLLALQRNVGFAEGSNVGLRAALEDGHEFAWLLNNDALPEADCLERLATFLGERPEVALAMPRIVGEDGIEQRSGGVVDSRTGDITLLPAAALTGRPRRGAWLGATAWLVRPARLRRVGLFDPRFFAYWEDADLCARLLRSGGDFRAVPEACVTHAGGASSGGPRAPLYELLMTRNAGLYLGKHAPRARTGAAFLEHAAAGLERAGALAAEGNAAGASAIVAALAAIARRRFGPPGRLRARRLVEAVALTAPLALGRACRALARLAEPSRRARPRRTT